MHPSDASELHKLTTEIDQLYRNLTNVQERCTQLINERRSRQGIPYGSMEAQSKQWLNADGALQCIWCGGPLSLARWVGLYLWVGCKEHRQFVPPFEDGSK